MRPRQWRLLRAPGQDAIRPRGANRWQRPLRARWVIGVSPCRSHRFVILMLARSGMGCVEGSGFGFFHLRISVLKAPAGAGECGVYGNGVDIATMLAFDVECPGLQGARLLLAVSGDEH